MTRADYTTLFKKILLAKVNVLYKSLNNFILNIVKALAYID